MLNPEAAKDQRSECPAATNALKTLLCPTGLMSLVFNFVWMDFCAQHRDLVTSKKKWLLQTKQPVLMAEITIQV